MSKLSLRTDRIENLFSVMNALPSHLEESTIEYAERAICRAAAEISGLTEGLAKKSADLIEGEYPASMSQTTGDALRRFAQLAAEDE